MAGLSSKQIVVKRLRDLPDEIQALQEIPYTLQTLNQKFTALRSATNDGTPVRGGTNNREDMMIANILERQDLEERYKFTKRQVRQMQAALDRLTAEERTVLDKFYMHRTPHYLDELCDELCCERTHIYDIKDQAILRLARQLTGLVTE